MKKLVSSEQTDTEIFSAQAKTKHANPRQESIHHRNPHSANTQIRSPQPSILPAKAKPRRLRHAPDTRAAPSDGLSGREGLAGIRRGTVQRLSSAALAAAATTATAALDVVIDAGGNPLGVVVALQGRVLGVKEDIHVQATRNE